MRINDIFDVCRPINTTLTCKPRLTQNRSNALKHSEFDSLKTTRERVGGCVEKGWHENVIKYTTGNSRSCSKRNLVHIIID